MTVKKINYKVNFHSLPCRNIHEYNELVIKKYIRHIEVSNILTEIYMMLGTESLETVHKKMVDVVCIFTCKEWRVWCLIYLCRRYRNLWKIRIWILEKCTTVSGTVDRPLGTATLKLVDKFLKYDRFSFRSNGASSYRDEAPIFIVRITQGHIWFL